MSQPRGERRVTTDRRRVDRRLFSESAAAGSKAPQDSTMTGQPAELWDARDVARHLKVSVSWVRQRVSARLIPFVRIGGWMVRFRPDEIRAFCASEYRGKVLPLKGPDRG